MQDISYAEMINRQAENLSHTRFERFCQEMTILCGFDFGLMLNCRKKASICDDSDAK
ncbi:MAG: hypothetical protein J6V99_04430 [Neisseriaceae bacterium]|nr:hypothetical protein [Neisseriaceae bacterium]